MQGLTGLSYKINSDFIEMRKFHYDLSVVPSAVRLRGADAFTATHCSAIRQ
jgi:hypothetical protein